MREVRSFYEIKKPLFERCLLFLSEEHGENIQIALALSADNDPEAIQKETDDYFRAYMSAYPSSETKPFPYGECIWGNYANNSVAWNRYEFKWVLYGQFFDFSQATSFLLIDLLEDDYSLGNTLPIATFLCTKALRIFSETNDAKPADLIDRALKALAKRALYDTYVTEFDLHETLGLYGIDDAEIMEMTAQYWAYGDRADESEDGSDPVYRHWEDELKKIAAANVGSYLPINRLLWDHFDVSDELKLMIMYSLKAWRHSILMQK